MPNTKGAQKALRVQEQKRIYNLRRKRAMDSALKAVRKFVAGKQFDKANEAMPAAHKAIDKAAKRGFIKQNTAARKKSRLSSFVKKAQEAGK